MFVSGGWLQQLHRDLRSTQKKAFAKGTIKNLKVQWNKFYKFAVLTGLPVFPISLQHLCLYVQFLSRSLQCPKSVSNYVSGVKLLHQLAGLPFPDYTELEYRLTMRGLIRVLDHVPQRAAPITPVILLDIFKLLDVRDATQLVFWCLFLFMFFLFSRKSQFLPVSLSSQQVVRLVCRKDVTFSQGLLWVAFRWTKTRQAGKEPLLVPLAPIPGSPLCPVTAYSRMISAVPSLPHCPAFVLSTPSGPVPVLYSLFHQVLRSLLSKVGLDPRKFSSHSFRRGGASFAFRSGVRGELIQKQGDWASDAYKLYLSMDIPSRVAVAQSMSKSVIHSL